MQAQLEETIRAEMERSGLTGPQNFVRIACIGGRLARKTYARGSFGETTMPTELDRT